MILPDERTRPGGKWPTLNPYRVGAKLILDRLRWDFSPNALVSRMRLQALRNSHIGQKAVILCNGPSLRDVDFSELKGVFTFGLNKINLLFEQTTFRPSAIVAVNPLVIEQNRQFFQNSDVPLFLDSHASRAYVNPRKNICFLHSCNFPYFSRDCSVSVFQGYTVTYVALQLAYHMGFNDVALLGCDHNYPVAGVPNRVSMAGENDAGHFCDNYFSNQPWQLPDLVASELYYDMARRCYAHDGRRIVNASTQTKLFTFPQVRLKDFLHN